MRIGELIDCDVALSAKRNKVSTWKNARDRLINEVWPIMNPSFLIQPGAKVFTIGSCFARNIEEHLQRLGFKIPMLDFRVPREECAARANGILNKFTPAAICQEIDWAKRIFLKGGVITEADSTAFLYECGDGSCIDTDLARFVPVARERFFQRRSQIYDVFKEAFNSAYVVITPGLIEAWFDRDTGVYIDKAPLGKDFARHRSRFGFQVLSYAQCREFIQNTIDAIRDINQEAKFLITTSPVPLSRTFTDKDVIIANTYSKSLLRTVAGDIAASNKHVDYFPSYESVMLTKSWNVWGPDLLHVADAFVGKVVERLTDIYCPGLENTQRTFLQSYINLLDKSLANALELARQAVEGSPEDGNLRKHYGYVLAREGNFQGAEAQYRKGIALMPEDATLHFWLSEVMVHRGRLEEAIDAAHRSTELAPDNELYHRHLARLCIRRWKFGEAALQFALANSYRRLRKTKHRGLKRFIRFALRRLETTRRSTQSDLA